jgi:hypothetical protein
MSMKSFDRALLFSITIALLGSQGVLASGDDYPVNRWSNETRSGVPPQDNERYAKACGSCHYAYQAGLLPALSWEKIMLGLDNHFGKSLELGSSDFKYAFNHLLDNAAGRVNYVLPNRIVQSLREDPAPLRVTEVPYLKERHSGLETAVFMECGQCHTDAKTGEFSGQGIKQGS